MDGFPGIGLTNQDPTVDGNRAVVEMFVFFSPPTNL